MLMQQTAGGLMLRQATGKINGRGREMLLTLIRIPAPVSYRVSRDSQLEKARFQTTQRDHDL